MSKCRIFVIIGYGVASSLRMTWDILYHLKDMGKTPFLEQIQDICLIDVDEKSHHWNAFGIFWRDMEGLGMTILIQNAN